MQDKQTIHETIQRTFNKTSSGKIFEKDFKDIFAMTIVCLNLTDTPVNKYKFNPLQFKSLKSYPYLFHLDKALQVMHHLNVVIELTSTTTSISYSIEPDLGLALVTKFYEARLLHSPADRTRDSPKAGVLLQPTPKGTFIVHDYCRRIGMKNKPSLLQSNFNSMELFCFDRDALTDKIAYSNYFLYLLFVKVIGDVPNIWSPTLKPDQLPSLQVEDSFSGDIAEIGDMGFDMKKLTNFDELPSKPNLNSSSPFYHRYFTNPESDSHIQYYVSTGVRFAKDKVIHGEVVKYCVSGKAICQWLNDCTDIISIVQAIEIASLLLEGGLFEEISANKHSSVRILNSRDTFYKLTPLGELLSHWPSTKPKKELRHHIKVNLEAYITSFGDPVLIPISNGLTETLKDPGMRHLFRKHLEKEYCLENLDSYLQLKLYEKKTSVLAKLLIIKKSESDKYDEIRINQLLVKFTNVCLALAYHIFFTYLSSESPFVLNIDYNLRASINLVMLQSQLAHYSVYSTENEAVELSFLQLPEAAYSRYRRVNSPKEGGSSWDHPTISQPRFTSVTIESSDIKSQKIIFPETESSEEAMESSLETLLKVSAVFSDITAHIFRLMQVDSFPKFMESDIYSKATAGIQISRYPARGNQVGELLKDNTYPTWVKLTSLGASVS